jgi:hypothetical protein
MTRCSAIKPDGKRCTLPAKGQLGLCWAHDPANAQRRRMIASRGGRARVSKELRDIKTDVRAVVGGVLAGELDSKNAAVALQGFNTLLRAAELEQKADLEDLARQVKELQRGYGGAA